MKGDITVSEISRYEVQVKRLQGLCEEHDLVYRFDKYRYPMAFVVRPTQGAAERLRGVQIENRPAAQLIERFNFPNVLIYADPPYVLGARYGKQYRHEMSDADHAELLDLLLAHRGPVLISGYDNALYNDALRHWHREETTAITQTAERRREVMWMNFEPPAIQERLF